MANVLDNYLIVLSGESLGSRGERSESYSLGPHTFPRDLDFYKTKLAMLSKWWVCGNRS
jgi:hypothetical protein